MKINKTKALAAVALMVAIGSVEAQPSTTAHSSRSAAMGGCLLWDFERHLEVGYRQTFFLSEMAEKRLALWWPVNASVLYATYVHRGTASYYEQTLVAAYGLQVARWLHVGLTAGMSAVGADDPAYDPQHRLMAGVWTRARLSEGLHLSLWGGNRPWSGERPMEMHLQMQYRPVRSWSTLVELESDDRLRLRCGMEYSYLDLLFVRAGVSTAPLSLSFGAGARYRNLAIDLAVESHRWLGLTPHTSLSLWF